MKSKTSSINGLTFVAADVLVSLAKLPAPLVAELPGIEPGVAELLLSVGSLVASGPLIGGAGGAGTALQDVVDQLGSFDLVGLLSALIEAPFTVAGGVLNGETGPNLQPFIPIIPSILAV